MLHLLNLFEFIFSKPLAYFLKTFGNIRRKIAEKNLEVCFPELSPFDRSKILNKHYLHLGASIFNGLKAWILSSQHFEKLLINLDEFDLDELRKSLQGNLVLIPHTTDLEITGRVAAMIRSHSLHPYQYRPQKIFQNHFLIEQKRDQFY